MQNFLIGLYPIFFDYVCVGPKWHFNMYLGKIFICSCIVKMPKWNFLVVLDSDEYQFLGIMMIMHVYHVLIIGCMFYTLCPMTSCSCIGHASHMHTRCTIATRTLTLNMFCIH